MSSQEFIDLLKAHRAEIRTERRNRLKTIVQLNETITEDVIDFGRARVRLINHLIRLERKGIEVS